MWIPLIFILLSSWFLNFLRFLRILVNRSSQFFSQWTVIPTEWNLYKGQEFIQYENTIMKAENRKFHFLQRATMYQWCMYHDFYESFTERRYNRFKLCLPYLWSFVCGFVPLRIVLSLGSLMLESPKNETCALSKFFIGFLLASNSVPFHIFQSSRKGLFIAPRG